MNPIIRLLSWRLKRRFDRSLERPEAYQAEVAEQQEAYPFPEWDIVPHVFPVLAYASIAERQGSANPADTERMAVLLRLAVEAAICNVQPPYGDLRNLRSYSRQGVYLGLLSAGLAAFRWATADQRFSHLQRHLCDLLHGGFEQEHGGPIWSYPTVSWPFDSVAALFSLCLRDRADQSERHSKVIRRHLDWIGGDGCDHRTGLPWSMVPMGEYDCRRVAPRGCALALMLPLLWAVDPDLARTLYTRFVSHFWQHRGPVGGFREWSRGTNGGADIDSGPVVWGYGAAATGFGLAATQAAGDWWRSGILSLEFLVAVGVVRVSALWQRRADPGRPLAIRDISLDHRYVTGFLLGDACLFMALTLRPFGSSTPVNVGDGSDA